MRLYACYRLEESAWYDVAWWTFAVALLHFASEVWVFRSTSVITGALPSLCIATGTVVWMGIVKDGYVG